VSGHGGCDKDHTKRSMAGRRAAIATISGFQGPPQTTKRQRIAWPKPQKHCTNRIVLCGYAAEHSSGRALIAELGVAGEKGIYYLGIPVDFGILIALFPYADRRFLGVGRGLLLRAISASSKNLLLRGCSPGPNSQPTFGGGHFRLCDGAIHRPFFEERSLFLAFLKPCDDMARD
jgi:hypothetical protein